MVRKELVKQTLVRLLEGAHPVIEGDSLTIGKLKIRCTESGYANIILSRPLDFELIKSFFKGMDVYTEGQQGSILVKRNANIYFYAEPDGTHRVAFGPNLDYELLLLVFRYIRALFQGLEPH